MYTKEDVNAMRKKLIEKCEESTGKKDGTINCNSCKIGKKCSGLSGHPPKYMSDELIIELWELLSFSTEFTAERLVAKTPQF